MCREYSREELRIIHQFKRGNPDICYYCGKHVSGKDKTVDHKIPRSRGGRTYYSNLCIACEFDNQQKGDMTDTEYIEFLQSKNSKHVKNLINEIDIEKHKKLSHNMIVQEHDIMEARNDSRTRSYIKSDYRMQHMNNLFKQIEAM